MSLRSRAFQAFTRLYAAELADAVCGGALARPGEATQRQRYTDALRRGADLNEVVSNVLKSEEFAHQGVAVMAPILAAAMFRGLLERKPDPDGLATHSATLAGGAGLDRVAADMIRSKEFRDRTFAGLAPALVRSAFRALLGREPGLETIGRYAQALSSGDDLAALLNEIVRSDEFRGTRQAASAPEWLRAVIRSLLERDPEPEEVAAYCQRLATSGDLEATVAAIVRSEECSRARLAGCATELVHAMLETLLHLEPGPEALAAHASALQRTGDLRALLTQLLQTEEYRKSSMATLAPDLVRAMFEALLERPPDPPALSYYVKKLATGGELAPLMAEILRSDEFARRLRLKVPLRVHKAPNPKARSSTFFTAADLEIPKLVFMHHPKTGGTTLHHILIEAFEKHEICPERFNGLRSYPAGELARYRFFSGHFDLASVRLIPGRKKIVTMLREPVSRLISLYYFQRAHRSDVIEREGLELARLANLHRMKEFFLAPEVRAHPAINNSLTRILVGAAEEERWEQLAANDAADCDQLAQLAGRELSLLDAFGLVERYAESVEMICAAAGLQAPQRFESRQVFEVITAEEPGLRRIDKEPVTDEVKELVAGIVEADRRIYTQAVALFEERLATHRRRNCAIRSERHREDEHPCHTAEAR